MFGTLRSLPLTSFIEQSFDPEALWAFIHIPKTAGSSFAHELARARRPYRNIHVDYSDQTVPMHLQMDRAVQKFIEDSEATRFRSCSGHLTIAHLDPICQKYPATKVITFLRNPVSRIVSDYRYARTPAHPPYQEFIKAYRTFEDYVNAPESQNKMSRILTGHPKTPTSDAIALLDERYAFIGLVEMYAMSFNVIFRMFGVDQLPSQRKRRTEPTEDNVVTLTDSVRHRIRHLNQKDLAIYRHVHETLTSKREEWLSLGSLAAVK